jgi:hypothetical protein
MPLRKLWVEFRLLGGLQGVELRLSILHENHGRKGKTSRSTPEHVHPTELKCGDFETSTSVRGVSN